VLVVTVFVVTTKLATFAAAATVTVAGGTRIVEPALNVTTAPPVGAAAPSVTLAENGVPPVAVAGAVSLIVASKLIVT
jgi:hypothetical protein